MRKKLSPVAVVGILVVALIGIGLLGWKLMGASTAEAQITVKPANPDDPKFQPDPKIGAAVGSGAPKGNSNE